MAVMAHWPLPPFFREAGAAGLQDPLDPNAPADAVVFAVDGSIYRGQLLAFDLAGSTLRFRSRTGEPASTSNFASIKSIQLIHPITLAPDRKLMALLRQFGGQTVEPAARPFSVTFSDGEVLQGETQGFVKSRCGLFIFLVTAQAQVVRIFVPEGVLQSYQVGGLLGEQLVRNAVVSQEALAQALAEQTRRRQLQWEQHVGDVPPVADAEGLSPYQPARLGQILMDQGLVSQQQLALALGRASQDGHHLLGDILVEMGLLSRARLVQAVAEQLNLPVVVLRDFSIEPRVLALVPKAFAFAHHVLPLLQTDKTLVVAVENPVDADYLDDLGHITGRQIVPVLANAEELVARLAAEYDATPVSSTTLVSIAHEIASLPQPAQSLEAAAQGPGGIHQVSDTDTVLVRLVNKMVEDANAAGASDIHVEAYPGEEPTRIRFRIDGILSDYLKLPSTLRAAMISRLKIMANLDISEHRKPQDGKIDFSRFAPIKLELRVASLPTANGLEDIVMRLLASSKPIPLDQLGFSPELAVDLKKMMHRSYGLILVCGPTGSGKTTTLHSLLAEVNTAENKIWTAEDPIEITHPGLRQIQMIPRAGLTFATAMRAFLRADPDIIMVGEMRDAETTHIAIEASLTGHLVLSTLHTNSAPESVVRLLDMGLDPFSFSDALIGVLSQRLARKLCVHCKVPVADSDAELAEMAQEYCAGTELVVADVLAGWRQRYAGLDGTGARSQLRIYTAPGCAKCNHTGHKGRVGIYELMTATPASKKLIQARAPVEQLFRCALKDGMLTLRQYGLLKVLEGLTDRSSVRSACA